MGTDAHPSGKRPFTRNEYIHKFCELTEGISSKAESVRFLNQVQRLKNLKNNGLRGLNIEVMSRYKRKIRKKRGIFL